MTVHDTAIPKPLRELSALLHTHARDIDPTWVPVAPPCTPDEDMSESLSVNEVPSETMRALFGQFCGLDHKGISKMGSSMFSERAAKRKKGRWRV